MTGNDSMQKMEGLRSVAAGIKYTPVCVKAAQIDGETIKEDTWYTLKNGEFVEVEE